MTFQSGDEGAVPARIGSYRIEERIGSGGMGVVYRAYDEVLHRPLAVKQVQPHRSEPRLARRLRREARAVARLNHPAIVQIYDIVETEEGDWIAMELVEGRSLEQVTREPGRPLLETLRLAREIAEGLAEAHAHGIIHRDLKAGNVMVTPSGHAKILDFGLAKLLHDESVSDLSLSGALLGTYYAMSPEQIEGLDVDHRSDLFSLGTLLYQMCTGVSPFRAETVVETLARVCSLQQVRVDQLREDVPRDLADLIDRLLAKEASRRPESAAEVARVLGLIEQSGALPMDRSEGLGTPGHAGQTGSAGLSEEATMIDGRTLVRPLPGPASSPERTPTPFPASGFLGERRQMTIAQGEIIGPQGASHPLSEAFDPKDLYELMLQLRALIQRVASGSEGYLESLSGQRFLIAFGYPRAHEDDARRAVRASFDLLEAIAAMRRPGEPEPWGLTLRAGIHTGPAIVSAAGTQTADPVALGETLNVAVALRSLAEPGQILVSSTTCALIQKSFLTEAMAPERSPELAAPVTPHRVLGVADAPDDSGIGLVPVVGRELELGWLLSRWDLVLEGRGQVVLISGEAGIGKSRLVLALRERLGGAAQWLASYGSSHAKGSPLQPVVNLLRRAINRPQGGSPLEQLERFLGGLSLLESLPLFAALLETPLDGRYPALSLSPDRQREQTLEALVALTLETAERQPLVFVIEDLHWLDPTTLSLLDRLIDQAATAPLFLVLTLRLHTMETLWGPRSHLSQLTLSNLSETEAETLVDRIVGGRDLPAGLREQIVARTDGVPLYVEELTKAVLESGGSGDRRELPATLRDSLTARLDRLETAREVAQLASVIGRSFTFDLLLAISPLDEAALQQELRRLIQAELIYRKGFGAQAKYFFKHALVQDAAYESLLPNERQEIHLRIAELLETRFPETAESQPELVAYHYTESSHPEKSVRYWTSAGGKALVRMANQEAAQHVRHGLEALAKEPAGLDRDEQELALQTILGPVLLVTKGYASPEVKETYTRAHELWRNLPNVPALPVLWGLFTYHSVQGDLVRSLELGSKILQQAEAQEDVVFILAGHTAVGVSHLFFGHLDLARFHLEQGLAFPSLDPALFSCLAILPDMIMAALSAISVWFLGFPSQALERCEKVREQAHATTHLYTRAAVQLLTSYVHYLCGDLGTALQLSGDLVALSQAHGLFLEREGGVILGCSKAAADPAAGLSLASRSIGEHVSLGFRSWCTLYASFVIGSQLDHGRREEAAALLEQTFCWMEEETQERLVEADLYRLKGTLILAQGDLPGADALFRKALLLARQSSSRSLELRAAMSLARLWQRQERQAEAHQLLAEVYGWFTEGFETGDLREAQALLEELASPARS